MGQRIKQVWQQRKEHKYSRPGSDQVGPGPTGFARACSPIRMNKRCAAVEHVVGQLGAGQGEEAQHEGEPEPQEAPERVMHSAARPLPGR
jgi:hypothetical protein